MLIQSVLSVDSADGFKIATLYQHGSGWITILKKKKNEYLDCIYRWALCVPARCANMAKHTRTQIPRPLPPPAPAPDY